MNTGCRDKDSPRKTSTQPPSSARTIISDQCPWCAPSGSVGWGHASTWRSSCTQSTRRPAGSGRAGPCAASWWSSYTAPCGRWGTRQGQTALPSKPFLRALRPPSQWWRPVRTSTCPTLQGFGKRGRGGGLSAIRYTACHPFTRQYASGPPQSSSVCMHISFYLKEVSMAQAKRAKCWHTGRGKCLDVGAHCLGLPLCRNYQLRENLTL